MCIDIGYLIGAYRDKNIQGKLIQLVPITAADAEHVVNLRNRQKNRYYLNQNNELSVDGQKKWIDAYLERDNDLYWCINNKVGDFIGTIRIYDICKEKDICVQGSFVIDEDYAAEAPYAIEAELLTLDFIFDVLGINNVVNEDRNDNKVMNNLSRKLGFKMMGNTVINGVDYNYYVLTYDAYKNNRDKFSEIIDYWCKREK